MGSAPGSSAWLPQHYSCILFQLRSTATGQTATAINCNCDWLQLGPTATATNCNGDQLQLRPTSTGPTATGTNCNRDQLQLGPTATAINCNWDQLQPTNCNCGHLQLANCNCDQLQLANCNCICNFNGNQLVLQHQRPLILSGGVEKLWIIWWTSTNL